MGPAAKPPSRTMQSTARDTIDHLACTIGPRPAGSPAEWEAAVWVTARFNGLGLETRLHEFRCPSAFAPTYLVLLSANLVAAGLCWAEPLAALIVSLLVLAGFALETLGCAAVARLMPRVTSGNAVGRIAATEGAHRTIVITAHLDSAFAGLAFRPGLVRLFRPFFLGVVAVTMGCPLMALLVLCGIDAVVWATVPVGLVLLWGIVLMAHQAVIAQPTCGAGDNAAGVAALLLLAERLRPFATTDVLLVATGAEEAGLFGMIELLRSGRFDRDTTYFLNIDNVGAGPLRIIEREGILAPLRADTTMVDIASSVASDLGMEVRRDTYRALPVESAVALMRHYRALSLVGTLDHWHQVTDTAEHVDPFVAEQAAAVAEGIVRRLAEA